MLLLEGKQAVNFEGSSRRRVSCKCQGGQGTVLSDLPSFREVMMKKSVGSFHSSSNQSYSLLAAWHSDANFVKKKKKVTKLLLCGQGVPTFIINGRRSELLGFLFLMTIY